VATRTGLGVTPSPERAVIFQFALAVLVLRLLSDLRQDLVQLFSMDLEDVCHAADRGGVCPRCLVQVIDLVDQDIDRGEFRRRTLSVRLPKPQAG
jgi:hypothetical protein